ncbi:hypothetical protein BDU57DRAFT_461826 [Ampelomyces quisqualis]|uniref:Uncharacterized protein n=1 Tax=Ampelomyces quisqualis TaxID=50730 RepID=A0A6A5Q7T5_AMPQU|nr:hypothetical protein BDU57DRAFT_461826 [Ampelomyces quisqualis]
MAQISFRTLPSDLPDEIALRILKHWMEPQELVVQDATVSNDKIHKIGDADRLHIIYACKSDEHARSSLPPYLFNEFWRLRRHSWLKGTKYFSNPYDFYVSHCILLDMPEHFPPLKLSPHSLAMEWTPAFVNTALQPATPTTQTARAPCNIYIDFLLLPRQPTPTHGLERIALDFSTAQYFALFDVRVPPFHRILADADVHLHGAAILLQHCTHLTLVFGDKQRAQHPWYDLDDDTWNEAARLRPKVCDMGVLVDVVLEHAWGNGYIQHVEKLILEGDLVQAWVRRKWEVILAEWSSVRVRGGNWRDWPPACTCAVGCWTLGAGVEGRSTRS